MNGGPNERGLSAPGVHALVDKVGDKIVVFGRECGEVQRLLQHSGVLGVGLPRGRERGAEVESEGEDGVHRWRCLCSFESAKPAAKEINSSKK